jgi:hypothetical protein
MGRPLGEHLNIHEMPPPNIEGFRKHLESPLPIVPEAVGGSPALALVVGAFLGGFGALVWAWVAAATGSVFAWPAVVIGAAVGLGVRLVGGSNNTIKSVVGTACAVGGIGGGIALIAYQWDFDQERLASAADFTNIAFVFIGVSLARSLSAGKNVLLKQPDGIRRAIKENKQTADQP